MAGVHSQRHKQHKKNFRKNVNMARAKILIYLFLVFLAIGAVETGFCLENSQQPLPARNPFFRAGEDILSYGVKGLAKKAGPLKLEGILLSSREKIALISGRILREGQVFEGRQVISIEKDRVLVKDVGKVVVLDLPQLTEAKSYEE